MKISSFTQNHGLRRPSIDYYAYRALSYAQFQRVNVIYALFYQLMALPHCSEDIHVIRHKTHFWMSEIQAAYQGTPHHPVTQDLQNLLKTVPVAQKDWLGVITAIEMEIDGLLLESEQEIGQYGDRLYGGLYRMIAMICGGDPQSVAILPMAQARTLLSFIQHPESHKIRVLLPENAQTQVYTLFDQAIAGLKQSKKLKPLRVLARLYQRQALQPMVNLSPLKLIWLSIRERLSS